MFFFRTVGNQRKKTTETHRISPNLPDVSGGNINNTWKTMLDAGLTCWIQAIWAMKKNGVPYSSLYWCVHRILIMRGTFFIAHLCSLVWEATNLFASKSTCGHWRNHDFFINDSGFHGASNWCIISILHLGPKGMKETCFNQTAN